MDGNLSGRELVVLPPALAEMPGASARGATKWEAEGATLQHSLGPEGR